MHFPFSAWRRGGPRLVWAAALWTCVAATSQSRATTILNFGRAQGYFFDSFGIEAGLPGVPINAVCQTRDGYLWIATGAGLARFDGVRFVSFRPTDTPAFQTPVISSLCETHDGALWIGTARGVVRYRDGAFVPMGLADDEVHTLAEDRAGRIWMGTADHGLFVWDHGQLRRCGDGSLADASIYCLHIDQRDRVWVGTDSGAFYFEQGVCQRLPSSTALNGRVEAIAEQPAGTLWFGARSSGLVRWQDGAFSSVGPADGLANGEVTALQASRDGGLWIADAKLQRIDRPDHPNVRTISDVPKEGVLSVYEDHDGSVWLSAKEGGLIRGSEMPYRIISTRDGLPDGVRSIAQDGTGNLWLASENTIARIAPDGVLSTPLSPDSLPRVTHSKVVLAARDGAVWIGTAHGLHVLRNGEHRRFEQFHDVYGLFEDRSGAIWIGTVKDGLFRYRDGQFMAVPLTSGQPVLHATNFCEGPDRTVYATTWGAGFVVINGDRATSVNHAKGLPTDEVRAIYVDADNRVWLGFRGHGLGLWQEGRCWNPLALAESVGSYVSAIAEDARGQLWLGTPAGVMWVNKAELIAASRGEKKVADIRIAHVNRSLRTASVWAGSQSVFCATRDQRFLFATHEGILAIDLPRLPSRTAPPPVHIERVAVEGRAIDASRSVSLAPGAKNILLDYTAPSFIEPHQVLFRYRLEGYDPDWIEAKGMRTASYSNLAPGTYTFHVTACNADGIWNPIGASLTLVQLPHFYQTGAFFGLMGLGVAGAGFGLYRWSHHRLKWRLKRLEEKHAIEKERRRIAKNLHDDLGADLTEIGLCADAVQKKIESPRLHAEMAQLSDRVRALAGTLDAIVWSANPANDSLDRLSAFVCGVFQRLCRMAEIRCRIDVPQPLPASPLSPDKRSHLFLAAREAMTNLAKHSGATEAWLRLKMEGKVFQLRLEDDGRGFDLAAAEAGNRNGLANIRSRLAELGGTVTFDSALGRGTTITMRVPLEE